LQKCSIHTKTTDVSEWALNYTIAALSLAEAASAIVFDLARDDVIGFAHVA
jgi:hypothetical protein